MIPGDEVSVAQSSPALTPGSGGVLSLTLPALVVDPVPLDATFRSRRSKFSASLHLDEILICLV